MNSGDSDSAPIGLWALRIMALAYAAIGVSFMVIGPPKVPYADPYRFLATYLTLPFPDNVLAADNGHREILPNLVRVAELHWFDANQWLQIILGLALSAAATLTILGAFKSANRAQRTAITTLTCVGVYWLGNGRKLAHGNEVVPLFMILLSLAIGLRALGRRDTGGAVTAAATGIVATLTFGSGAACFAALFAVLFVQRAPFRHWLVVAIGSAVAATLLLTAGGGESATVQIAPLEQLSNTLRWLGAPFVWAASPLLDTAHAARLPTPFDFPAELIAGPVEAVFGPHLAARWPAMAFGGLGLVGLLWQTVRAFRRATDTADAERFALGLAWFGCAVGVLVTLARLTYFRVHPEQLTSQRYIPWSMMFWIGLGALFVLRCSRMPRVATWTALAVAVCFAPSQVWTGRYILKQRDAAELTAVGAAVGVIGREFPLVETKSPDLHAALPILREHETAMFAWPEAKLLGKRPAVAMLDAREIETTAVENRLGAPGSEVRFELASAPGPRVLLVDEAGVVRGLAIWIGPGHLWRGWLRGHANAVNLSVAVER